MLTDADFELIRFEIQKALSVENLTVNALIKKIPFKEPKTLKVIRFLLDNGLLVENERMKLELKK